MQESGNATIAVYPNPASTEITFVLPGNTEGKIELYDLPVRKVQETGFTGSNTVTLLLNDALNGIYIYKVISKNNIQSGKIVIQ